MPGEIYKFPSLTEAAHRVVLALGSRGGLSEAERREILAPGPTPSWLSNSTLAELLGKNPQTLMNELSRQEGFKFGADLVIPLSVYCGSDYLARVVARALGGVYAKLPKPEARPARMGRALAYMVREFGQFMEATAEAMEDGRLDQAKYARLVKEGWEAMEAIYLAMLMAGESLEAGEK